MINRRTMLAGTAASLALAAAPVAAKTDPVATTTEGRLSGTREGGLSVFRGIRYGEDTAHTRFQAPVAAAPWSGTRAATGFGPVCPQRGDRYAPHSEDCLFLNVWTPDLHEKAKRPVMVYFHGGAYSTGSVTDPLNDGRHLAARGDVVVVTVNHRLNAFGYLYLAGLDARFADSGNVGQLDLILALDWIKRNIAAFGGDASRVMVFGQSGGGAKIATLMGMPAAKGLFHSAATMSGQQVTAQGAMNGTARTRSYMAALGLGDGDVDKLLTLPTGRLVEALSAPDPILGKSVYFGPTLDMKWLVRHPFWPDANPQSTAIPMILGNTHDETRAFISPDGDKVRGLSWDNIAARLGPELKIDLPPDWVVAQYRAQFPHYSPEELFYAATTAGRSWPGQVIEADARAAAGANATWVYQLDFPSPLEPRRGAFHTHDIPLVFGTLGAKGSLTGTGPEATAISGKIMDAFIALARRGNPNHAGMANWPAYDLPDRATMVFDSHTRAVNDPRKWQRELFARAPYIQPGS
ncbi:carboxylesterase/lipase family protein [Kordiimonas sp.]|uniref:carboxylesterase/lipase family protein n=1 Tax=Kordiimonas sp. TaxID=1970157 RepID=UPI003A923806